MTWCQTFSGQVLDLYKVDLDAILLVDIAHALSMLCRFNGHCRTFYSVAEHSVYVAEYVDRMWEIDHAELPPRALRKAALLHDAAEAYVFDVPRPLKYMDGMETFRRFEEEVELVIHMKYIGDSPELVMTAHPIIKRADDVLLAAERDQIMAIAKAPWDPLPDPPADLNIIGMDPERAERLFLEAARERGITDKEEPQRG